MENQVYQKDGDSIHRSGFTHSWPSEKGVRTIGWPAKSPDLNIIENIWGIMAHRVYLRQRQFHTVEQLKEVIEDVWATNNGELLQKLYRSIPRRILALLDGRGRATKYYNKDISATVPYSVSRICLRFAYVFEDISRYIYD